MPATMKREHAGRAFDGADVFAECPDLSTQLLFDDPLYSAIVQHRTFQRLMYVPFMGILEYVKTGPSAGSRGDHSLQVALLALAFAQQRNLRKQRERVLVASALLHDLSHPPFSHTLEIALKKLAGFSPEKELDKLLSARDEKEESIETILSSFHIRKHDLPILWPKKRRPAIFGATHNVDTLEGITRSYNFFNRTEKGRKEMCKETCHLPWQILGTFDSSGRVRDHRPTRVVSLLDRFWEMKDEVYSSNIYDCKRLVFERISSYYLHYLCREEKIDGIILRFSDRDLFSRFPSLRSRLCQLWTYVSSTSFEGFNGRQNSEKCMFATRRFVVDKKQTLSKMHQVSALHLRYKILPHRLEVSFDQKSRFELVDILSYPYLNGHLEDIAKPSGGHSS